MTLVDDVTLAFEALTPPGAHCLVAVSGGADSLALLDLLATGAVRHGRRLTVGHVDHGIHPESGAVAVRVEREAAARGLPVVIARLELDRQASETTARRHRRAALRRLADEAGAQWVVLAHHADDQIETILLRLFRGSGPAGLAGMASKRGRWIRPLLLVRHADLVDHLRRRGILSWSDPANTDPRHLRSWLRTEILPLIGSRLPDVGSRLLLAGRHAARARSAWDAIPALLPALELVRERDGISVAAPPLRGYRSAVRHAIVAAMGRHFGVPLGARRLQVVDRLLDASRGTTRVQLAQRLDAELAGDRLTLFRRRDAPLEPVPLAVGLEVDMSGWRLEVRAGRAAIIGRVGWNTDMEPGEYVMRPWRPGDRIRPHGGRGSRAVAVLLREAQVAPHRRSQWPVIVDATDATIVWVPGICRSDARQPAEGSEAWHVECAVA